MNDRQVKIWAAVPAAGIGSRMHSDIPKQYLDLNGKPVIQHTIERLQEVASISGIVIALHAEDDQWSELSIASRLPLHTTTGGEDRASSVLQAMRYMDHQGLIDKDEDWVLVHDAVRPCVDPDDIQRLIDLATHSNGGILASPVKDTIKRAGGSRQISDTVDRSELWHAFTPQLFRWQDLNRSLSHAIADGYTVTDEASAMEHAGYSPMLVDSSEANIKITRPEDLALAEFLLSRRPRGV